MGVNEGLEVGTVEKRVEGWMERKVKMERHWWWVVGIYVSGDLENKMEMMAKWMEEEGREERVIIGGDFNVRTGTGGGG